MRLLIRRFPAVGGLLLFALLCAAMAGTQYLKSHGATIIVTNTNDNGPGSLRQALADASDGGTIQFDPALNGQTINLTSVELVIDKNITINGPGSDLLTVARLPIPEFIFRIFHITPNHTVAISGLTITGGNLPQGGPSLSGAGILNEQGTLTIENCSVSSNSCLIDGGGISNTGTLAVSHSAIIGNHADFYGGGISNAGTLTITNSTVRYNASGASGGGQSGFGGGIYNGGIAVIVSSTIDNNVADAENHSSLGGGIYSPKPDSLTVSDSTISQNVAFIFGGAIFGGGNITNCTISGNIADYGGGIYVTGPLKIGNTILDSDADGSNILNDGGTVTSHGYNVSSDNGGGFLTAPGDQINTAPMLGPLQDNGGLTFTHELLIGSPAINSGDPAFTPSPDFDQRGPGFPRVSNSRIDIGSFEVQHAPTPTVTPSTTPTSTPFTPTPTPSPTPTFTPSPTPTSTPFPPTPTPTPTAAQALNLSTRMLVQTGDNVGIGGFIITGTTPKQVGLRGIGPSLSGFGIPNALADPVLELHGPPGFPTIINDNWRDRISEPVDRVSIEENCFDLILPPPSNDLESGICATLGPGAYTAILSGKNNGTGVGLVEVYDLDQAAASKVVNISTRAFVGISSEIVIAGFILGPPTSGNDNIIVRGIGPSLTNFGVPNALADPQLELRTSSGTLIQANNNWMDEPTGTCAAIMVGSGLAPSNALESAICATLAPGQYTAVLSGVNNGTGVGLIEVYDRESP